MPERATTPSLVEILPGKTWRVVVLSDDLERTRPWVQALARADLQFTCDSLHRHERVPWSQFDLIVVHLGRDHAPGTPRTILHEHQGCLLVLGRPATGAERAWWIDHGADDCVSEPCDPQELVARLRASLRRQRSAASRCLRVGPLTLWPRERAATLNGRALELTTSEFSLLATLAEHCGEVLGREALLELASGSAEQVFERAIDVQISRLRAKLGDDPRRPRLLKTVRGLGYVLVAPVVNQATQPA